MRYAVRNEERWGRRRTPTQYPSTDLAPAEKMTSTCTCGATLNSYCSHAHGRAPLPTRGVWRQWRANALQGARTPALRCCRCHRCLHGDATHKNKKQRFQVDARISIRANTWFECWKPGTWFECSPPGARMETTLQTIRSKWLLAHRCGRRACAKWSRRCAGRQAAPRLGNGKTKACSSVGSALRA